MAYIINWADGTTDVIHYYYHYDEKKKKASRRMLVNGEYYEGDKIFVRMEFVK